MKTYFPLAFLPLMLSSCWQYKIAERTRLPDAQEQITFTRRGWDWMYGSMPYQGGGALRYPTSALDASGRVDASKLTYTSWYRGDVAGHGDPIPLKKLSGYLQISRPTQVEVKLSERRYDPDGKPFTLGSPMNDVYRLKDRR